MGVSTNDKLTPTLAPKWAVLSGRQGVDDPLKVPARPARLRIAKMSRVCSGRDLMKRRPAPTAVVSLYATEPPRPECPKCHFEGVEDLYSAIPRWLVCLNCGHMWSNRTPYSDEERFRVLQVLQR
jgi:hypothetical protein